MFKKCQDYLVVVDKTGAVVKTQILKSDQMVAEVMDRVYAKPSIKKLAPGGRIYYCTCEGQIDG